MPQNNEVKQSRLHELDALIGSWDVTMSGAWFLDSLETEIKGSASFEWLENAFVLWKWKLDADEMPEATPNVIGYSSAADTFEMFYYDGRGVSRIFDMQFDGKHWSLLRRDPDFYQKLSADVTSDKIDGAWYASEDKGITWSKDFDLLFTKHTAGEKRS